MKRFFRTAIFIILLLCNHISYAQDKADPPADTPVATAPEETNVPTVPPPEEPQEKAKDEYRGIASKDLAAQKRMANAAEEMSNLVFFQNIIGGLGLILVGLTTYFAFGAWRVGQGSVDVARNAIKAEFQPYLSFSNLHLAVDNGTDDFRDGNAATQAPFEDRDGFVHFLFTVEYANWGKTPAQDIRFEGSVLIRELIKDQIVLQGGKVEPFIDLNDYLISSEGDQEYIFSINVPSKNVIPYEATHIDLLMKRIKVEISVFFTDQFSENERCYVCVFDGLCHDNTILKTSVKEIKQT